MSTKRLKLVRLFLAVTIVFASTAGAQRGARSEPDIDTILRKSQEAWNRLDSGSADFTQTWTSAASGASAVKRGHIDYIKPGKLHANYLTPEPVTALIEGNRVLVYYAQKKAADQLTAPFISNILAALGAGQAPELTRLLYDVTKSEHQRPDEHSLDFALKGAAPFAQDLSKIRVGFDKTTFLARRTELIDKQGDSLLFEFGRIVSNAKIDPALFEFQPPAETSVRSFTDLYQMLHPLFTGAKN